MPDADDALYLLTLGVQTRDWRLLSIVYEISEHHTGQPSKWSDSAERLGSR